MNRGRPWRLGRVDGPIAVVFLAAAIAYTAILVCVSVVGAAAQRGDARQGSIDEATSELLVIAAFAPGVLDSAARMDAGRRQRLDASWRRLVAAHGSTLSVRMWRADGSLVYQSPDSRRAHGAPFTTGAVPSAPWTVEQASPPALHVYMPVRNGRRFAGVAELERPLGPLVADEIAQARAQFWRSMAVGAIVWVLLLPVWLRISRLVEAAWAPRRRLLVRRVRRSLVAGELEVHYQPKMRVASGEVDGFEALVRWRRDGRLVAPGAFLPDVEQSPLIRDLTLFVLDTALRDVTQWERDGLHAGVAVNIAPASLTDARLVDDVASAVQRHGVNPARLTLEVTEMALLDDKAGAGSILERLADLGVCLSVDDFGTGHSSLARLTRHPFRELKIDRSFVLELTTERRPVVATVVSLAGALGLQVVAEGVEDGPTLNALRALGCDVAQGYLLGAPVPARDAPGAARAVPHVARAAADVRSLLDGLRESLDLDAAFIAEFVGDHQVFRWTAGNGESFGTRDGDRQALCDSYCARVVERVFPNVIADARGHAGARRLPITGLRGIGAYIGVPLHRPDGTLYGTLCGLASIPRPDLDEQDVALLEAFGERLAPLLESAHLAVSSPTQS